MAENGNARRPDERIQDEASDRLVRELDEQATQIQVHVVHGQATLTGTVDSPETRSRAEEVVRGVADVDFILNNLRVAQAGTTGATG